GHRDASLVHIESSKHIIVTRDECLVPHRSASFGLTAKILAIVPLTEHSWLTTAIHHTSLRTNGGVLISLMFSVHADALESIPNLFQQPVSGLSDRKKIGDRFDKRCGRALDYNSAT